MTWVYKLKTKHSFKGIWSLKNLSGRFCVVFTFQLQFQCGVNLASSRPLRQTFWLISKSPETSNPNSPIDNNSCVYQNTIYALNDNNTKKLIFHSFSVLRWCALNLLIAIILITFHPSSYQRITPSLQQLNFWIFTKFLAHPHGRVSTLFVAKNIQKSFYMINKVLYSM